MKKRLLVMALLLAGGAASATTEKWTAGWDNFSEPLNFTNSNITWSVSATTRKLTVTFKLVGATPSKLYQVGVHIFCTTFPKTFGQFPSGSGGACTAITRQGVTKTVTAVEFGSLQPTFTAMVASPSSSDRLPQAPIIWNSMRAMVLVAV